MYLPVNLGMLSPMFNRHVAFSGDNIRDAEEI